MKRNILLWIAAMVLLLIYSCDVDYDPPAIPTTKTTCIHVVDSYTNEPLDSVLVEMTLRYKDKGENEYDIYNDYYNVDHKTYSDNTGNACITYDKGSSVSYSLRCTKPGYSSYSMEENVNWFYIEEDIEVKLIP